MTTINPIDVVCSNCGAASRHMVLGSTNQFGPPDLDLRPPEMARSTMSYWLQECPDCGLVAPSISDPSDESRSLVASPEYASIRNSVDVPPLARRFLCRATISVARGRPEEAFDQVLSAAWVADDAGLDELAREFRLKAATYLQGGADVDVTRSVQLLDVLRRAQAWDAAAALVASLSTKTLEDPLPQVVAFQGDLISSRDSRCYTVQDALTNG